MVSGDISDLERDLLARHYKVSNTCGQVPISASLHLDEEPISAGIVEQSQNGVPCLRDDSTEDVECVPAGNMHGVAGDAIEPEDDSGPTLMTGMEPGNPDVQPDSAAWAAGGHQNVEQAYTELAPGMPGQENYLLGSTVDIGDFDHLWDNFFPVGQPLPAEFTNTDFSLMDLSDFYMNQPNFTFNEHMHAPTMPTAPMPTPATVVSTGRAGALTGHSGEQSYPLNTRLPSLEPSGSSVRPTAASPRSNNPKTTSTYHSSAFPWRITPAVYRQLEEELKAAQSLISQDFTLPTRHALSRCLEGYFRGFHAHLPFLHVSTLAIEKLGLSLVLALAAMGALYRFEHTKGFEIFRWTKSYICWQLTHLNNRALSRLTTTSPGYAGLSHSPNQEPRSHNTHLDSLNEDVSAGTEFRLLQGLIVLMATASWGDRALMRDAISMSSQVGMLVRHFGIGTVESHRDSLSWIDWVRGEERRRTLLVAFVLFNLQCIAFDVPPQILNSEVKVNLPSSEAEWAAPNEQDWRRIRTTDSSPSYQFQRVLGDALSGLAINSDGPVSAFGNYVLIQAIFQQVFHARNATTCFTSTRGTINAEYLRLIEPALQIWQDSWEATRESTLDPSSPKGPLGFNSTALLRLVHIRLNADTGPSRRLISRDPQEIAQAFSSGEISVRDRSPHLDRAVLQCIHALSVPIRVGIAYVARTQAFTWSFQHALCNLECAFFLTHWLQALATDIGSSGGVQCLRPDERKLFDMLASLVQETEWGYLLDEAQTHASRVQRVSAIVLRAWAETFKGFQVFDIVHMIGNVLSTVADMLMANQE